MATITDLAAYAVSRREDVTSLQTPGKTKQSGLFVKGPIPLDWLAQAGRLPGKAAQVGTILWFLSGLNDSKTVKLTNIFPKRFGVDRFAKNRALVELENAGLVAVARAAGRAPVVAILARPVPNSGSGKTQGDAP